MDVAGLSQRMSIENQFLFGAARFTPWLLPWIYRSMAGTTKALDTFVQQLAGSLPQVDVVAVQRENCGALPMADQNEAFRPAKISIWTRLVQDGNEKSNSRDDAQ